MRTPFTAHPKLWFLVPLLSFLGSGIPAHATGQCAYDRNSAIHYANLYANEPGNSGYYWFPGHDRAGNDCASFVSQCLIAGGLDVVSQANQNGFGYMLHAPPPVSGQNVRWLNQKHWRTGDFSCARNTPRRIPFSTDLFSPVRLQ